MPKENEWKTLALEMINEEKDEIKLRTICRLIAAVIGVGRKEKERQALDRRVRK